MSDHHVVLADSKFRVGQVVTTPNATAIKLRGGATIPAWLASRDRHALAGFGFFPVERPISGNRPGAICRLALAIFPDGPKTIHWKARVGFLEEANGYISIAGDTSQVSSLPGTMHHGLTSKITMSGLELDPEGCVVVEGAFEFSSPFAGVATFLLQGCAFNASVLWAAVSQA